MPLKLNQMQEESIPYLHRDISWLTFNYRVLQEAKDPSVPLFERIKFLAIYSSNLDEFFRVRVAHQHSLVRLGKKTKKRLEHQPEEVLKKIHKIVNKQQEEFSQIFMEQIIPELANQQIFLRNHKELKKDQKEFAEEYFQSNLLPYVQPVLLEKKKIRVFLKNATLYLAVHLIPEEDQTKNNARYAIIQIPSEHIPRFIELPSADGKHELMMLDDLIRHNIYLLFPGFIIEDTYSLKLTRDAEIYIEDEYSGDLIEKIKKGIRKRKVGPATRFVFDRTMPKKLLEYLMEDFSLQKEDLIPEGRYHNNYDFFGFPNFDLSYLTNPPLPPLNKRSLEAHDSIFKCIKKRDHLLNFPYQSYKYVVKFFEEAANDPAVTHIKIIQYRVAAKSRIMDALMKAAQSGKQVTSFVEVKARFDEEANLSWAERLEKAGVHVLYSFPGLKVHAKLALISRIEDGETKNYCYLGTGNFHEKTAKIYSDLGLFTKDTRLTNEVARIFKFLETVKEPKHEFKHLLVGQFNLRSSLNKMINKEIKNARAGKKAMILIKCNSLEDKAIIQRLYAASAAGVTIKIIVRGICSLVPGIKGVSENIEAISIVDRFLEHARIFYFYDGGKEHLYLSSADLMTRNLSLRIETAFPILDKDIAKEVKNFLRIQLKDNVKARIIDGKKDSLYRKDGSDLPVRAQLETYYYLKRKKENGL